ncbi:MAG: YqgE/AlgH family protein, partial [Vicinamibacterales bacterium]
MSLAPALLLSMPQLIDPNFAKSVVLLCEHAPEGAFGLVVNRPSDVAAAEAVGREPPGGRPNALERLVCG